METVSAYRNGHTDAAIREISSVIFSLRMFVAEEDGDLMLEIANICAAEDQWQMGIHALNELVSRHPEMRNDPLVRDTLRRCERIADQEAARIARVALDLIRQAQQATSSRQRNALLRSAYRALADRLWLRDDPNAEIWLAAAAYAFATEDSDVATIALNAFMNTVSIEDLEIPLVSRAVLRLAALLHGKEQSTLIADIAAARPDRDSASLTPGASFRRGASISRYDRVAQSFARHAPSILGHSDPASRNHVRYLSDLAGSDSPLSGTALPHPSRVMSLLPTSSEVLNSIDAELDEDKKRSVRHQFLNASMYTFAHMHTGRFGADIDSDAIFRIHNSAQRVDRETRGYGRRSGLFFPDEFPEAWPYLAVREFAPAKKGVLIRARSNHFEAKKSFLAFKTTLQRYDFSQPVVLDFASLDPDRKAWKSYFVPAMSMLNVIHASFILDVHDVFSKEFVDETLLSSADLVRQSDQFERFISKSFAGAHTARSLAEYIALFTFHSHKEFPKNGDFYISENLPLAYEMTQFFLSHYPHNDARRTKNESRREAIRNNMP